MNVWHQRFGPGMREAQVRMIKKLSELDMCRGFVPVETFFESARRGHVTVVGVSREDEPFPNEDVDEVPWWERVEAFCIFDDQGKPQIEDTMQTEDGSIVKWYFLKNGQRISLSKETHAEIIIWCSKPNTRGSGRLAFERALEIIAQTGKSVVLAQGVSDQKPNEKATQLYEHEYGFRRLQSTVPPDVLYRVYERGPITEKWSTRSQ